MTSLPGRLLYFQKVIFSLLFCLSSYFTFFILFIYYSIVLFVFCFFINLLLLFIYLMRSQMVKVERCLRHMKNKLSGEGQSCE